MIFSVVRSRGNNNQSKLCKVSLCRKQKCFWLNEEGYKKVKNGIYSSTFWETEKQKRKQITSSTTTHQSKEGIDGDSNSKFQFKNKLRIIFLFTFYSLIFMKYKKISNIFFYFIFQFLEFKHVIRSYDVTCVCVCVCMDKSKREPCMLTSNNTK